MKDPRPISPCVTSRQLVHAVTDAGNMPKADGAYGRRHHSRGLWGFWNPPRRRLDKRMAKATAETAVDLPGNAFIGFRIIKHG